jgi:micrococcal nuclease
MILKPSSPDFKISIQRIIIPIAICLALVIISPAGAGTLGQRITARVARIVDGDTVVVGVNGREEKVRLIGIDAPECRPNPKAEKDSLRTGDDLRTINEMGQKATRYVKSILRPGDHAQIEMDVGEGDRYGRLLGYVWLQDGRMLNEEMVKGGYASLMTYPPNVKYRDRFEKAYREAREARRGLWSDWKNE